MKTNEGKIKFKNFKNSKPKLEKNFSCVLLYATEYLLWRGVVVASLVSINNVNLR